MIATTTSRKHVAQIAEGGFHIQLCAVHIHMGNRSTINWTSNTSTPLTNEFRVSYQPTYLHMYIFLMANKLLLLLLLVDASSLAGFLDCLATPCAATGRQKGNQAYKAAVAVS